MDFTMWNCIYLYSSAAHLPLLGDPALDFISCNSTMEPTLENFT
jgi:hypothetical protein